MSEHSAAYQQFLDSFAVTGRESSEDYALDALGQLVGDERAAAEALLIETIRTTDDPRAAKAVRALGLRSAVPALREAVARANGQMLVQSAFALFTLTGEQTTATSIVRVLRDGDTWARVDAAHALGHFRGPSVDDALYAAIDDPEPLVRANAVEALLHLTGLSEWDVVNGRGISLLGLRLRSAFGSIRQAAVRDLKRLAAAKRRGATPESLGVPTVEVERSAAAARALRSFGSKPGSGPWADHFDLDAIAEIAAGPDDGEREWALATLLLLLDRGDTRAPA
ncbi:MAG: HEAT repeat domain-containing protein, partial [Ilumatobacteraceae bacterium]